jgi:hypothetical protein
MLSELSTPIRGENFISCSADLLSYSLPIMASYFNPSLNTIENSEHKRERERAKVRRITEIK